MQSTLDLSDANEENEELYKKGNTEKIVQMVERIEIDRSRVWLNTVTTFQHRKPMVLVEPLRCRCAQRVHFFNMTHANRFIGFGSFVYCYCRCCCGCGRCYLHCLGYCCLSSMIMWRKAHTVCMFLSNCARKIYSKFFFWRLIYSQHND